MTEEQQARAIVLMEQGDDFERRTAVQCFWYDERRGVRGGVIVPPPLPPRRRTAPSAHTGHPSSEGGRR